MLIQLNRLALITVVHVLVKIIHSNTSSTFSISDKISGVHMLYQCKLIIGYYRDFNCTKQLP